MQITAVEIFKPTPPRWPNLAKSCQTMSSANEHEQETPRDDTFTQYNLCFYRGDITSNDKLVTFVVDLRSLCKKMGIDNVMHLWSNLVVAKAVKMIPPDDFVDDLVPKNRLVTSYTIPTPKPFVLTHEDADICCKPTDNDGRKFTAGTFTGSIELILSNPKWTPALKMTLFEEDEFLCKAKLSAVNLTRIQTDKAGDELDENAPGIRERLSQATATLRHYMSEFKKVFVYDNTRD